MDVVIVGSGLAGLTAAQTLRRSGVAVMVLEAAPDVGGRVRTRNVSGFTLDRGFQVLFTAYPAVKRNLDLEKLNLVTFPPAAVVRRGAKGAEATRLGDPLRDPGSLFGTLTANVLTLKDRLLMARLALYIKSMPLADLLSGEDETTFEFLKTFGFSGGAIANFFAPFFGGIFLKRDLSTSARLFRYYFRMLMDGSTTVPRRGIGEVTQQLAAGLEITTGTKVEKLEAQADHVVVHTTAGSLTADSVVVATDPPELQRLTGVAAPSEAVSSTYLYYASDTQLDAEKRLLLNAEPGSINSGSINNAVWASNLNPDLAPPGNHLLVVTVLGLPLEDSSLDVAVRGELAGWYGETGATNLRLLHIDRIGFAQFAQPPGFVRNLVGHATPLKNVLVASEATSSSSIQGAMESGEKAAAILLNDTAAMARARGT